MQCLFTNRLIADKGMYLRGKWLQNKRYLQLFFPTEKSPNKKKKNQSERSRIHHYMTEIYVMHGNGAEKSHYHMSYQPWSAQFQSNEKSHSKISNTVSNVRNCRPLLVKCTALQYVGANWNDREMGNPNNKSSYINSHFILEAIHPYFKAASCDEGQELAV